MSYLQPRGFQPWNRTNNPLLLKDDVGKGKPSAYDLPNERFMYGKPLPRDQEGARDVTSMWNFHQHTTDQEPQRDFKQLNKLGVSSGCFKSSQQSQFRQSNDARVKVLKGKNALPILIPEEDFRYGQANRPSTPVKLVMGNCYGLDSESRLTDFYKYQDSQIPYQNKTNLIPRGNKASVLSYQYTKTKIDYRNQDKNREQFKLTKFKQVNGRTDTNLYVTLIYLQFNNFLIVNVTYGRRTQTAGDVQKRSDINSLNNEQKQQQQQAEQLVGQE